MKRKIIILVLFVVAISFYSFLKFREVDEYIQEEPAEPVGTLYFVNFEGKRYKAEGYVPAEVSKENIIGYIAEYNKEPLKHGQTNFEPLVGRPYAIVNGKYYVYYENWCYQDELFKFYFAPGWKCFEIYGPDI